MRNLLLDAHIGKLIRKENPDNNPFSVGLQEILVRPQELDGIKLMDDPSPYIFYIYKELPGHTVRANLGGRDITPRTRTARGVMSTTNAYHTRYTYTLATHITRGNR